jgi:hypothetical protein
LYGFSAGSLANELVNSLLFLIKWGKIARSIQKTLPQTQSIF